MNRPVKVASGAAAAFTTAVVSAPFLRLAYENLSLHVVLETIEALIGALLAFLAFGRYRSTRFVADMALATAFAVFALTNLLVSTVPVLALGERPGGFTTWAAAALRLGGAAVFCGAAWSSARRARPSGVTVGAVAIVALVAVAALAAAADVLLADAIDPTLSPAASDRPRLVGHPVVLAIQLIGVVLYAVAARGFALRARVGDTLLEWLAAGAVVGAFARVHYFLFPSLYSEWVYTGDFLRLTSYVLFLVGAIGEIRVYWDARSEVAVLEERQRLARELHDGLVQELSFIRSRTAMTTPLAGEELAFVAAAAERALVESRFLLGTLASDGDDLDEALRRVAEPIVRRGAAELIVEVAPNAVVGTAVRNALLGVIREAATNAVRHGRARTVVVSVLASEDEVRLTVADDGSGFETASVSKGFGLRSMTDRVKVMRGTFDVQSTSGRGTVVVATFPTR